MTDIYLRAPDEDTLLAALEEAGLVGEASTRHALDMIGSLYADDGEKRPGFHANLRLLDPIDLPEALTALVIYPPVTPSRVWAS